MEIAGGVITHPSVLSAASSSLPDSFHPAPVAVHQGRAYIKPRCTPRLTVHPLPMQMRNVSVGGWFKAVRPRESRDRGCLLILATTCRRRRISPPTDDDPRERKPRVNRPPLFLCPRRGSRDLSTDAVLSCPYIFMLSA